MNPIVYCAMSPCSNQDWKVMAMLFVVIVVAVLILVAVEFFIKKK